MIHKEICPVCLRSVHERDMTLHHWIPQSEGGTQNETMYICQCCHQHLHYTIPLEQVSYFNSIQKLENHWIFWFYIRWIRDKNNPHQYKIKKNLHKWMPNHLLKNYKKIRFSHKTAS